MKTSELIFIGIKGSVVALDQVTGRQMWSTHLKGWNFVNVVVEEGRILASCSGEIFCLDPRNGNMLWHNPLKGLGTGLATIATQGNSSGASTAVLAEKQLRDDQAASAGAAAAT